MLHVLHGHEDALFLGEQAVLFVGLVVDQLVGDVRHAGGEMGAIRRQLRVTARLVQQVTSKVVPTRHCKRCVEVMLTSKQGQEQSFVNLFHMICVDLY